MERKTTAVVAAFCLIIVLLSGQLQQAAAMTKYCRCYKQCYAECRKDRGPYPCNFECLQDCFNGQTTPPRAASPGDCGDICIKISVCGVVETAMATAACVADCTNKLGAFAPSAAKINYRCIMVTSPERVLSL